MANEDVKDTDGAELAKESRVSPPGGLCDRCRWLRIQRTQRGARFYRCGRADEDATFQRYPPLPMLRCAGFESVDG